MQNRKPGVRSWTGAAVLGRTQGGARKGCPLVSEASTDTVHLLPILLIADAVRRLVDVALVDGTEADAPKV